jgi:HEAT repeat protein
MKVIDDTTDEPRLREAAGVALGYVLPEDKLVKVLEKVRQADLDPRTRALYVQALWQTRTHEVADALVTLLEGPALPQEMSTYVGVAIGEAGDPGVDARLVALLDKPEARRTAALAVLLAGTAAGVEKVLQIFKDDSETLDITQQRYQVFEPFLTREAFTSGRIYRRLMAASALRPGDSGRTWAWDRMIERLKAGWSDGPEGVYPREIRALLAEAVRQDAALRDVALDVLIGMNEQGVLLSLEADGGAIRDAVRAATQRAAGAAED